MQAAKSDEVIVRTRPNDIIHVSKLTQPYAKNAIQEKTKSLPKITINLPFFLSYKAGSMPMRVAIYSI
jgi:hypothetical protein